MVARPAGPRAPLIAMEQPLSSGAPFRVRTLTVGIDLRHPGNLAAADEAMDVLERGRAAFEAAGYEVQTIRMATEPFVARMDEEARHAALAGLQRLDRAVTGRGVLLSLGPVLASDRPDESLPAWAAELARSTGSTSFSIVIASPEQGAHARAVRVAAETIVALAAATDGGEANFRFAAAANIAPNTPFFPVAYHSGPRALAIGLETAGVVEDVFTAVSDPRDAVERLRDRMTRDLRSVEQLGAAVAEAEGLVYAGIDASPAPAQDRSIGAAIEAFTHRPFGSASTLQACAAVTTAIKALGVQTCGYTGLMLPVLEDPVLAKRAGEGRYGLAGLLLCSSVRGTGLDLVPLPGDASAEAVARILSDVAALSVRLQKPLSARLFLVPGKTAGEVARFANPLLTDSVVFASD